MTLVNRKIGAIIGAAVADAAAQPLHWNFDLDHLQDLLGDRVDIEFRPESANAFYTIKTGSQSCYGDQTYVILKSLVECGGFNENDMKARFYKMFGPDSTYDVNMEPPLPIMGPWKHKCIRDFLENYEAKKEETGSPTDEQIDGVTKIAPIVALHAGKPDMLDRVEEVVRVLQESDIAVACALAAARLLEVYILNGVSPDAVDLVIAQLSDTKRKNPQDLDRAVAGYLREVVKMRDISHVDAVKAFNNN